MASAASAEPFEADVTMSWRLLSGLPLVGLAVSVVTDVASSNSPSELLSDWSGALFYILFGLLAIEFLRDLLSGQPALRIDEEGLHWRTLSRSPVPWEDIALIEMGSAWGQDVLSVYLREGARLPPTRLLGLAKYSLRWASKGDFDILTDMLDCGFNQAVEALERFYGSPIGRGV